MKILLEIAYVGTDYHGFQVQNNAPSVQKTLQTALESFFGVKLLLSGYLSRMPLKSVCTLDVSMLFKKSLLSLSSNVATWPLKFHENELKLRFSFREK